MPQPYVEMEESRSVTPWVNRLYFESPLASSFLGLRLVKARHKNLVPLFSGVKPDPMVGSGRYAESIPVKSPMGLCRAGTEPLLAAQISIWLRLMYTGQPCTYWHDLIYWPVFAALTEPTSVFRQSGSTATVTFYPFAWLFVLSTLLRLECSLLGHVHSRGQRAMAPYQEHQCDSISSSLFGVTYSHVMWQRCTSGLDSIGSGNMACRFRPPWNHSLNQCWLVNSLESYVSEILMKIYPCFAENALRKVVSKRSAILFVPQCVSWMTGIFVLSWREICDRKYASYNKI